MTSPRPPKPVEPRVTIDELKHGAASYAAQIAKECKSRGMVAGVVVAIIPQGADICALASNLSKRCLRDQLQRMAGDAAVDAMVVAPVRQ